MKKNKTIAYMLAATLLVGGTFLGTKALFTDVENAVGELAISTGDVDIKVVESSVWELDRNGAEYSEGTNIKSDELDKEGDAPGANGNAEEVPKSEDGKELAFANNLKSGDVLTKTVTVENIGTLMAQLDLNSDNVENQLGDLAGFIMASSTPIIINDLDGNGLLSPGETATFKLTLTAQENSQHNVSGVNSDNQEDNVVTLTNAWILTARQQN